MGGSFGVIAASSVMLVILMSPEDSRFSISLAKAVIAFTAFAVQWFLWLVYSIFIYPTYTSPFRDLPQPPGHTFWKGQLGVIMNGPQNFGPVKWSTTIPNDGLIRYFDQYNVEKLLVTSPKGLADLLVHKSYDFAKPAFLRESLARFLGNGIFVTEGEVHKRQRKHLQPAFAFRHVKDLYSTFWSKSAEMVMSLEDTLPKSQVIEVGSWALRATFDIIGVASMGDDFNTVKNPDNEIIFKQSPAAQFRGTMALLFPVWILAKLPSERSREIANGGAFVRKYCRNLVLEKREKMSKGEYGNDIISIALKSANISDAELTDHMMTFLAAGHETTAMAVQWTIYALCKQLNIQARLREEVRSVLPSPSILNSSNTAAASLDSVAYLHAVCNEALRIYPAVPFIIREAVRDTSILGRHIPKGTRLSFSPWALNLSKELWGKDADEFNPDRWMGPGRANTGGAESNYAFQTFLHGPRGCIGMGFAKAELACIVGAFVGRFEFRLDKDEPIKIRPGASIKPFHGVHVRMKVVEGW